MPKLSLYHDVRTVKDGESPVKIVIRNAGTSAMINTGVSVEESQWDSKKSIVKSHKKKDFLNNQITTMMNRVEGAVLVICPLGTSKLSASEIKKRVEELLNPKEKESALFLPYMEKYMEKFNGNTRATYGTAKNKLIAYCKSIGVDPDKLTFDDFDEAMVEDMHSWLMGMISENSANLSMQKIRSTFNEARKRKVTDNYPFNDISLAYKDTVKRALNLEETRELYNLDVDVDFKYYWDYFFIILFMRGISWKDLYTLRKTDVINGRIYYNRHKTSKQYSIKIEPELRKLMELHKAKGSGLFDCSDVHSKDMGLRDMNNGLKRIGPVIRDYGYKGRLGKVTMPLYPWITTYTARHAWATIGANINIPYEVISMGLGHSYGYKITTGYIDFDQKKADDANRKIIDAVTSVEEE